MSKSIIINWGDVIKSGAAIGPKMKEAIEADKRQAEENERLHPLKDYPYRPNFGYPIDPSA